MSHALYNEYASFYDKIYADKEYKKETEFIEKILEKHTVSGKDILEVGCGTGNYAHLLQRKGYKITGVDVNEKMLDIAREKMPSAEFYEADMRNFKLEKKFDAILGMFTVMNYNQSEAELQKTLQNLARHLEEDGIIVFDALMRKEDHQHVAFLEDGSVALYDFVHEEGSVNVIIFLIFPDGSVVKDRHKLSLFSVDQYRKAAEKANLKCTIYWDWSFDKKEGKRPIFVCEHID